MAPSKPVETASSRTTDRIAVLDDSLADQIAAGEVVERPASVVKELVENALDAGADRIEVTLEAGGTELIKVFDNGRGIVADDLPLALTRHATSKIRDASELLDIATLGFRGEALASIAAVARVRIRSRTAESDIGYEIDSIPGERTEVVPAGMPLGTHIEVHRLFASVPARRKFLRAEATEVGHCSEAVLRTALVHPHVTFTLRHGARTLVQLPAGTLDARVGQIMARRGGRDAVAIEGEASGVKVRAWFCRPQGSVRGRAAISIVVRKRVVSERALIQIVSRAAAAGLRDDESPVACVMIEPPPGTVDVNVHPQKSEVRFSDAQRVYAAVREVLARELVAAGWGATESAVIDGDATGDRRLATMQPATPGGEALSPSQPVRALHRWSRSHAVADEHAAAVGPAERATRAADEAPRSYRLSTRALSTGYGDHKRETAAKVASIREMSTVASTTSSNCVDASATSSSALSRPGERTETVDIGPKFLTALPGAIALFELDGDLLAVDLRALRTHLVFRRLQASLRAGDSSSQALLSPVVVRRSADDVAACIAAREALSRLGLVLDEFGDDAVIVRAVPAPLRHCVAAEDVTDLLERVLPWARLHRAAQTNDSEVVEAMASAGGADPAPRLARAWLRELVDEDADLTKVAGIERWTGRELLRPS